MNRGSAALVGASALLAAIAFGAPEASTNAAPARVVAEGTAELLEPSVAFPAPVLEASLIRVSDTEVLGAKDVAGPTLTAFFYFSATCSHCIQVAQELSDIAKRLEGKVTFAGIATGSNSLSDIRRFREEFGFSFEFYKDYGRRFGSDNQASSTPQLYLIRRLADGAAFETVAEFRPFWPGASLPLELRVRALLGQDVWQAFDARPYFGPRACGACHTQEYASWGLTHHSVAYWTLYERKEAENPDCVGCHVTGMGKDGGFVSGDHGSALVDVGCEACHGPGGPHRGPRTPAAAAKDGCVTCHDAKHSVRFSVERGLPHIDHFSAASMTPVEYREARTALVEGNAPRPLTAFPEGDNVGSEACGDCHAEIVSSFAKEDPHANAMKTLTSRGAAKDPACVRCHSVARPGGDPMNHHPGGVGCEACHGPGEQHVAAKGGVENIVGLGESCPVCVIEAICTRCHNPEQDPDWDLTKALEKIGHGGT